MPKHIGIVACSAEGAALCYRTICMQAPVHMGEHNHPEITMHTYPLSLYMKAIYEDNWQGVGELMVASAKIVTEAGAEFAICPDNTIHQAFDYVSEHSEIPWLHIGRVVAEEAKAQGYEKLGVLGTRYLMQGPVYPTVLQDYDISMVTPEPEIQSAINEIIFSELVNGIFEESSREFFYEEIDRLEEKGCDAVVLGCTEIPLIVRPEESGLPTLDSTRLLANAALIRSLTGY